MQSRLREKGFRPFIVNCLKTLRLIGFDKAMAESNTRLLKRTIFKQWDMVTEAVGNKKLVAVLNLLILFIKML